MGLSSVDTLKQLEGITFVLKVYQIFIIPVDPNICVRSPSSLNFLCSQLVLGLELNFFLSLQIASPGPLNLNGSNMIHCKSMVLEKPSSQ